MLRDGGSIPPASNLTSPAGVHNPSGLVLLNRQAVGTVFSRLPTHVVQSEQVRENSVLGAAG
jgi:hypothetical protein